MTSMSLPLLLLVDDAPDVALILRRLGKQAGFGLEHCADGEAAWDYLRRVAEGAARRPDLVLLDYNLPGETGAEGCRRLRADAAWAGLPVALFSHWGGRADLATAHAARADHILSKDLLARPEDLAARLGAILTS